MKNRFIFICILLIGGCTVGPKYQTPENIVQDEWPSSDIASTDPAITAWWTLFQDETLNQLIQTAATNNKDIARAEAAIGQARAMRDVAASKYFPQVTADVNAIKTYFSKNGPVFSMSPGSTAGTPSSITGLPFNLQVPQVQNLYTALFDATWEIDFFGKIRRSVEAAQARVESSIEQRNDTLITVLAEVARNYMELRSFQEQSSLIEESIRLLEQNAEIVKQQLATGYVGQISLETIEAQLSNARANLPDVVAGIYRSIYALSMLTGNNPEVLVDDLVIAKDLPKRPDIVSLGLRSDLLHRRPDVRKAERELAAATADVGVAVAAFYPTFSLLGDAGLQSLQIQKLFQSNSKTWAYGGDFNVPVYEGGKLTGYWHATQAAQTMALNSYQQTVLSALQNTESALVSYSEDVARANEHQQSLNHIQKIEELSSIRYEKGLTSLIDFIQSQLQLISAKQTLLKDDTASLIDLVSLYKALGGGWQPEE